VPPPALAGKDRGCGFTTPPSPGTVPFKGLTAAGEPAQLAPMDRVLSGKTALVTGGTNGIGKHIVELFTRHGAQVTFSGTNRERGDAVADSTGASFLAIDARETQQAEMLVEHALTHSNRIDILVNNAGGPGEPQGVEGTTDEAFDDTIAVHLRAPWQLMARVAPVMRGQGGGSIVNMASVAGQRVGGSSATYSVVKAALIHLTRLAAAEFGPHGIRVNSVSPGFISTSIHAANVPGDAARGEKFVDGLARLFLQRQALQRTGQPIDIAELVLFLASDASTFVSGADIVADGGLMWGRAGLM
jgi:NAD(P)-dependent dehydrogenase (short-subunit alcohol dehydrogenase family)